MREQNFSSRTTLQYVDIGPTGSFSVPKDPTRGTNYIRAIKSTHDVVLVDGRWRVACAMSAFPFVAPSGRLMIHDFGRAWYHSVLDFYTKETEVDGLAVLIPMSNVSARNIESRLARSRRDSS
jgi:hypothetical protein